MITEAFWAIASFAYAYHHLEFYHEVGVLNFGGHPHISGGYGALFTPDPDPDLSGSPNYTVSKPET